MSRPWRRASGQRRVLSARENPELPDLPHLPGKPAARPEGVSYLAGGSQDADEIAVGFGRGQRVVKDIGVGEGAENSGLES